MDVPRYRKDYKDFLNEIDMSEEEAIAFSQRREDQIGQQFDTVYIADSLIQGKGVMAKRAIEFGEVIGEARVGFMRTVIGRYANHSPEPNVVLVKIGVDLDAVAIRRINSAEEILFDYRQVGRVK
jgi:hypothetical protein